MGTARHGEGDADQQYHRDLKKQRQCADQPGDTHGVMRAILAKGFEHANGDLIDRAGFMQDFAKHRAQRDHNRQKAERAAHAFLHGFRYLIQRHAGEQARANRDHH